MNCIIIVEQGYLKQSSRLVGCFTDINLASIAFGDDRLIEYSTDDFGNCFQWINRSSGEDRRIYTRLPINQTFEIWS